MQLPSGVEFRKRKPFLGFLLYLATALCAPTLFIIFNVQLDDWYSYSPPARIAITIVNLLIYGAAVTLIYIGRGMREPSAAEVLQRDPRKPVLFLRAFSDDGTGKPNEGNYEELLKPALTRIGPVITVGEPDELITHGGGARLYIKKKNWKQVVAHLMDEAAAVVIESGLGQGLLWEEERALKRIDPEKILFLIPETKRSFRYGSDQTLRYMLLIERIQPHIPKPLPATLGDSSFLIFDRNWNPQLLPNIHTWIPNGKTVKWKKTLLPFLLRFSSSR